MSKKNENLVVFLTETPVFTGPAVWTSAIPNVVNVDLVSLVLRKNVANVLRWHGDPKQREAMMQQAASAVAAAQYLMVVAAKVSHGGDESTLARIVCRHFAPDDIGRNLNPQLRGLKRSVAAWQDKQAEK